MISDGKIERTIEICGDNDMDDNFFRLADALSQKMEVGELSSIHPASMNPDEQGYSGAKLLRINCVYSNGKTGSFICKHTGLPERTVMQTLTEQKRGHTPFSYTDFPETDEAAWLIMQDIRPHEPIPQDHLSWKKQVATALADIHTDNLMCADKMPYLPHADEVYWKHITTQISIDHFENQCLKDKAFAAKYAGTLPKLRKRAEQFAQNMTALYREGNSLSITHGDLQSIDGDHVRCFEAKPMIIDWGFSRYAPFYIDLVDYFSQEEALWYLEELHRRGINLNKKDFDERYHIASFYPAFIYLYPALMQYNRGSDTRLEYLLSVLCEK